ncbi:hypothetical protein RFM99_33075 [Mesorhizobium sp. VK4C]|uniref:hypothetical protein n=1 Tax=Mesorhizobium captivum TaxID=3072319 RepID=UPI002A23C02C|nr:hypothetical protein [Mesorhizobium sp. VK4C]MDX8503193.1 hypothetical protein [Mesorhizobium sp. VK4C]
MGSTTPAPARIGRSLASTLRCTPRCLRTVFAVSVFDRVLVGIVISFSRNNACRWKRLALSDWQPQQAGLAWRA